jgi:rhamnosyltransferase
MKVRIAAVVVLYDPVSNVLENINTYINQVEKLFVVDNSNIINTSVVQKIQLLKKVEYICNNSNIGIASALKIGADKALSEGYKYLVTFDQDTIVPSNLISELIGTMSSDYRVAIAAPFYDNINYKLKPNQEGISSPLVVPTSANLLDLIAYTDIGPFSEQLFIDYVDFEYCLRLKIKGYKILQNNSLIVKHNVGNLVRNNILGLKFYTTNHPPIRLYYRTRNRLYLKKKFRSTFPEFFRKDLINFLKELTKIILMEKNKFKKLEMIFLGYRHFKINKMGKFTS